MNTIFISHAWEKFGVYQDFCVLLDNVFGQSAWINVSIPRDDAIDLSGVKTELESIEDDIARIEANLLRSDLPYVVSRTVWDAQGNRREIETWGSLRSELSALLKRKAELKSGSPMRDDSIHWINKHGARDLTLWPNLGNAIRRKVEKADCVFVLVTPACLFRRWINYEISLAEGKRIPVIGVMSGEIETRELDIRFSKIVNWGEAFLKDALRDTSLLSSKTDA